MRAVSENGYRVDNKNHRRGLLMDGTGSRLRPTTDMSPAGWLEATVSETAPVVAALLPRGLEAYARILHPADSSEENPVRWHTAAQWSGGVIHPRVQFGALVRHGRSARKEQVPWSEEPTKGELVPPLLNALCEVLTEHTTTPEHCWFCLWDGWGWIEGWPSVAILSATTEPTDADPPRAGHIDHRPPALPREVLAGPRVRLGAREYLLFKGPLDAAGDMGDRGSNYFFPQSPNLFWSADRAWCVATDIDLDSTYVGGSAKLISDLLVDPRLEVVHADPSDPVNEDSDERNA